MKEPLLELDLGTIIYDREWPDDVGLICGKDEGRSLYLIRWWNWGNFSPIWIKASYVDHSCSELTMEDLPLYYERLQKCHENTEKGKQYYDIADAELDADLYAAGMLGLPYDSEEEE